jgi:hypothetical protein
MHTSYQFLANLAGVKYPYKVAEQVVPWSLIMDVPGFGEILQGSF